MHKSRKLLTAAAVSLALSSTVSYALTLGDIEMRSALNQTMDAQIRLQPSSPSELTGLRVQLASQDAFSRAGLQRSAALNDLKFQVDESIPGSPVIRVTSSRPVVEPFLNFLLEVDWSSGRMVREYTVLLDPPVFLAPEQSQRAAITDSTAQRASDVAGVPVAIDRTPTTTVDLTDQGTIDSVLSGGEIVTLDSDTFTSSDVVVIGEDATGFEAPTGTSIVTETVTETVGETVNSTFIGEFEVIDASGGAGEYVEGSTTQFAEETFQPIAGETELGGDVVTLTDTSSSVVTPSNIFVETIGEFDVQVLGDTREVSNSEGAVFVAQETTVSGNTATDGEVRVRSGDTLSQIARANAVDGTTTQQMMLALLDANQQAFINGNINLLKAGAILRIPDASSISSLSQAQALTEVAQQEKLWQEYRDNLRGTSSTRVARTPATDEIASDTAAESSASDESSVSDQSSSAVSDSDAAVDADGAAISQSAQDILDQARDELEQARNELRLVGENEATDTASSTSADETDQPETDNLGKLNTELQLAREELESTRLKADELESRDEALTGTTDRFDSLINLRQNEVAKLEQQLADARRDADASEAADAGGLPQVELLDESGDTDAGGTVSENTAAVAEAETAVTEDSTRVVQPAQESTEAAAGPWYTRLLSDNKLLIALGVGLLALLGLLGTMFKRRKARDQFDAFDEDDVEFIDDFNDDGVMAQAETPDAETPDANLDIDAEQDSNVGVAVAAGGAGLAAAGAAVAVSADDSESQVDEIDSSLLDSMSATAEESDVLSGDSHDLTGSAVADGLSDDTISEADVYLAYGLHGQAEELLKKAIDEQPDHPEYQEKLLQTYHAQGNGGAFDAQAAEYQQRFGSDQAGWGAIAAMGTELNPTNALYKSGGDSIAAVGTGDMSSPSLDEQDFTVEVGETGMQSDGSDLSSNMNSSSADFMDQTIDPGAAFEEADLEATGDLSNFTQEAIGNAAADSDSLLGDLGDTAGDLGGSAGDAMGSLSDKAGDAASNLMGDSKAALGGATAGVAGLAAGAAGAMGLGSDKAEADDLSAMASDAAEEGVIEFDASIESKDFDVDAPRGAASDSLDMPSASEGLTMDLDQLSGDLQSDEELLGGDLEINDLSAADLTSDVSMAVGDADEMDTMMDLAKAYIDMGDNDSASSALDEIVKSGNPEQRSEAETLLRKIS